MIIQERDTTMPNCLSTETRPASNRPFHPGEFGAGPKTVVRVDDGVVSVSVPGSRQRQTPWDLYNRLIDAIPEDVLVLDYCLGVNWTYVQAESGMGVAYTARGGAGRALRRDMRGQRLKTLAELAKSWNMTEATLGVAALNAWYSQPERLAPYRVAFDDPVDLPDGTARKTDAFELYRPEIAAMDGANVVVVGHFPHVERIAEYANLVVLERNPQAEVDTPDPGCEYVIPQADFAFVTGLTITNKTAPRLLELARNARVVFVGPSVVMSPALFDWGVEMLAGSMVADPEKLRFAVQSAAPQLFGQALQMVSLMRPCSRV